MMIKGHPHHHLLSLLTASYLAALSLGHDATGSPEVILQQEEQHLEPEQDPSEESMNATNNNHHHNKGSTNTHSVSRGKTVEEQVKSHTRKVLNSNRAGVDSIDQCGVYLAPSTIPGAGLGMFAGKGYLTHEPITDGDIVLPLPEIDWHNNFQLDFFLWEEYTWSPSSFPYMHEEVDHNSMQGCSTGIGAALNCMLPLINMSDDWTEVSSPGGLHRSKDPGAGASTIFHNRKGFATRDIVPGEELYIDYGENYFESRTETYGLMPLMANYEKADVLLEDYVNLVEDMHDYKLDELEEAFEIEDESENEEEFQQAKQKVEAQLEELFDDLFSLIKNFPFESRTLNALPEKHSITQDVLEIGTAEQYHNRSIRSLDWLDQNGKCMDNVYPDESKLEQAGRGIFAKRFIPKDGLVMPAPLIHIKDKEQLLMYDLLPENEDGYVGRNHSAPIHYQLMLNYCFGHPESKILLSPYGMFNGLVNHNREKANTKIVWAETMREESWLEKDPKEWIDSHYSGLIWDFVATQDILPGEEIYIDYGDEWENAWKEHVKNFKPPKHSELYVPAFDLEENIEDLVVRTEEEGLYGPSIRIFCRNDYFVFNGLPPRKSEFVRCTPISRYAAANNENAEEYLYTAEIKRHVDSETLQQTLVRTVGILFDLPRDAFHFVDEPYSRDHQMPWSFRHEIMIPDEMFPAAWKNKKTNEKEELGDASDGLKSEL